MFKQPLKGYAVPASGSVDKLEIILANRGGGYVVNLHIGARVDVMVFTDEASLTRTLIGLLNASNPAPQPEAASVSPAKLPALAAVDKPAGKPQRAARKPAVAAEAAQPIAEATRRRGRPAGSKNKPKDLNGTAAIASEAALAA